MAVETKRGLDLMQVADRVLPTHLHLAIELWRERIEALISASGACCISRRSRSPIVGVDKQIDSRFQLLEQMQLYRLARVQCPSGHMYGVVDTAASAVRVQLLSVAQQRVGGRRG